MSSPILIFSSPTSISAKSNNVDTSNLHSAFSLEDTPSPLTAELPTNVSPMDSDFTTQAALSGVSARQTNNIVGVQSYYDVVFTTSTTGTIKFIDITFPAGTVIGAAPLLVEREGIGAGTAAKSSATGIRYTVTSAVSVPAGTQIRLEFFNIVNPTLPSTGYKVTVTTRNAGGTAIDGPTLSNSLNMKQIGDGQIADGAITSTKPAESFMKNVVLSDGQNGWNPNGVETFFGIFDPAIPQEGPITSFISIFVSDSIGATPENHFCDVVRLAPGAQTFFVVCSSPPNELDQLFYVLTNLPPNIGG